MPEGAPTRALLDTSVVIALQHREARGLPQAVAVSAVTLPELAAGSHAAADPAERARRQDRLQRAEATFDALPVDASVARAYGRMYAESLRSGTKPRGRRAFDLLIAATALAHDLALYTMNPDDFADLGSLIEVVVPPVRSTPPVADDEA